MKDMELKKVNNISRQLKKNLINKHKKNKKMKKNKLNDIFDINILNCFKLLNSFKLKNILLYFIYDNNYQYINFNIHILQ